MTTKVTTRRKSPRRRRMVRKQIYIYPQQDEEIKRLAQTRATSEAELIREALDTLLNQPSALAGPLPPDEAAWQSILQSIRDLQVHPERHEPYRWNREEIYEERMAKLLKGRKDEEL